MPSKSTRPKMALQLEGSSDDPRSGTKRERSPSPELGAGAAPSKKAKYSRKESKKDSDPQNSDRSGPTSDTDKGKAIDVSQSNTELDDVQEQGIATGDEELGGDTRDIDTRDDDVRDGDASYAGQISNPAGLSYSVTGRLLAGSSVNLEFAKDQYLHVGVEKDHDSGQAVQLTIFVSDKARLQELSETFDRQTSQQAQGKDVVDKGSQTRVQDVPEGSDERSLSQERQATQVDTKVGEGAGALPKNDQMDLDSETD